MTRGSLSPLSGVTVSPKSPCKVNEGLRPGQIQIIIPNDPPGQRSFDRSYLNPLRWIIDKENNPIPK